MPELSRFFGIAIFINFNEHNPPHFHAKYGDFKIIVQIKTGIVEGKFPNNELKKVLEWYEIHKDELLQNWNSIIETGEFTKIEPLK